ncbi:hypothetical protein MSPP1_002645 [Malassezia sp. CBS 17886]|nr:hypothetical protein MSPP1_002645 [Malassezia sp. CBS 17886]
MRRSLRNVDFPLFVAYEYALTPQDVRHSMELCGHTDHVAALAANPVHAQLLATAGADNTVRLWDLRSPRAARVLNTPGSNINLAYHPDGRYLAVGDKSETVSVVDTQTGTLLHTVKDGAIHREEVDAAGARTHLQINELVWAPDGSLLLLPMGSGHICFLRVPPHLEHIEKEPPGASAEQRGMHAAWDSVFVKPAHPAAIFCIQWDPTSRLVATGAADSTIGLWDAAEWTSTHVISSLTSPPRSLSFSHDGEWLAAGGEDSSVLLLSTETGQAVHRIPVSATINAVAWHPSRLLLAYGGTEPGATAPSAPPGARTAPLWLYEVP